MSIEPIDPTKFVDAKNDKLYAKLSEKYSITLKRILEANPYGIENIWQCLVSDKEINLSYYDDIKSSGFFTHELFHVEMNDRGFTNTKDLMELVNASAKKSMLFTGTIMQINNIFAHEKFYNEFIDLGYTSDEFVSDYFRPINIEQTIAEINNSFLNQELPNRSIEIYMTMFFTAKDNRNPKQNDDYNALLEFLNEKDNVLFDILHSHWGYWQDSQTLNNSHILYSIIEHTERWHNTRIIN